MGLGNPGSKYQNTRHNIGWLVLDRLADRHGAAGKAKEKDAAATVRGRIGDDELVLVKPLTYMNDSGRAMRKVLARERAPMKDALVIVDDMDLPFGKLRMKARGSAGGHNGLRSIIGEMGTESFARLRVGLGAPRKGAAISHVLGDFEHAEQQHLDMILDAAADAVELWTESGPEVVANKWNGWKLDLEQPSKAGAKSKTARPGPEPKLETAKREPESEPAIDASGAPADAPQPDAEGIVRTRTGWRRLLPDAIARRDRGRS